MGLPLICFVFQSGSSVRPDILIISPFTFLIGKTIPENCWMYPWHLYRIFCIYAIKATVQFNSDAAVLLRDTLRRNKLKLLVSESEGMEFWNNNSAYLKLSPEEQVLFQAPYYQTTMLVNEAINLSYGVSNGHIRISEHSGARKDRYSAVSYVNYIATQLERDGSLGRNRSISNIQFQFKQPQLYSKAGRWWD